MSTTITVAAGTNEDVAARINALFTSGAITTVNGRTITSSYGRPAASVYLNGTVSVTVKARTTRGTDTVYGKKGQTLTVA